MEFTQNAANALHTPSTYILAVMQQDPVPNPPKEPKPGHGGTGPDGSTCRSPRTAGCALAYHGESSTMKHILPAPLLSVFLFGAWLLLNHSLSAGHMVLGAILGLLIPIVLRGLRPLPVRIRHPWTAITLAATVVKDTTAPNLARAALSAVPKPAQASIGFVYIPLEVRDPNALAAVLAMIVCITPGTAWGRAVARPFHAAAARAGSWRCRCHRGPHQA